MLKVGKQYIDSDGDTLKVIHVVNHLGEPLYLGLYDSYKPPGHTLPFGAWFHQSGHATNGKTKVIGEMQ